MRPYDPFKREREARRKRLLVGLAAAAVFVTALLVLLSAVAGRWVGEDERAPAPAPASSSASPTAPQSSTPEAWPSAPQPTREASPSPSSVVVDRQDPEQVARAFVLEAASWDTTTDLNESAAVARAVQEYGADGLTPPPAPERPGEGWLEPARIAGRAVPVAEVVRGQLHIEDESLLVWPATGEPIVPVLVSLSWGWEGVDPVTGEPVTIPGDGQRTAAVSLVEREGQWQVIDFGWQQVG